MTPVNDRALIVPADLPGPSGGLVYNRRILDVWQTQGPGVAEVPLEGTWPHPDPRARQKLSQHLNQYRSVLVDGIIASAAPEEIAEAAAQGVEVAVLMHLPLPTETGLSADEQARLAGQEHKSLQHANTVVCTSPWAQRDLAMRYGPLPTALATPGCDPAPISGGSSPPQLLFLGAITPRKNPLLILEALCSLGESDWELSIVGPRGPDPDYVEAVTAAAERFGPRVQMRGPLTGARLQRVWAAADLLILPSHAETYGMVITEALARGVPALVGAGTAAEETLAAGQSRASFDPAADLPGKAVDPTDVNAWRAALAQWLEQPALRDQWRANALMVRDRLPTWNETATHLRRALRW